MAGCALPAPNQGGDGKIWSGRLALQVEDQASQSFSALFELRGSANNGSLMLSSPLGNRLAQLEWMNGHAQLTTSAQEIRTSDSLDSLLQDTTGTRIPVAALFSWLQGTQTTTPGWQADLSAIADGKLVARRNDPAPQATLRIVITQ